MAAVHVAAGLVTARKNTIAPPTSCTRSLMLGPEQPPQTKRAYYNASSCDRPTRCANTTQPMQQRHYQGEVKSTLLLCPMVLCRHRNTREAQDSRPTRLTDSPTSCLQKAHPRSIRRPNQIRLAREQAACKHSTAPTVLVSKACGCPLLLTREGQVRRRLIQPVHIGGPAPRTVTQGHARRHSRTLRQPSSPLQGATHRTATHVTA
jgi:hypothetical protein